jgi:hypothetical protein
MTDIAHLLRTQYDRDEAITREALDRAVSGVALARTPPDPDGQPSDFELCFEPEFILADLAAKRSVVDLCNAVAKKSPGSHAASLGLQVLNELVGAYTTALGVGSDEWAAMVAEYETDADKATTATRDGTRDEGS